MQVASSFVPDITPPDFVPSKEMNCKECSIKFLNLGTWTQHQAVAHGMKLRDWRSVYERRDGLKRNRALAWYRQCLKEHPPRRPPIFKQLLGDNVPTHTGTISVNCGSDNMVVDKELLAWMQEYKQCSAHYEHWFQANADPLQLAWGGSSEHVGRQRAERETALSHHYDLEKHRW